MSLLFGGLQSFISFYLEQEAGLFSHFQHGTRQKKRAEDLERFQRIRTIFRRTKLWLLWIGLKHGNLCINDEIENLGRQSVFRVNSDNFIKQL
jgi:hypothetical protein